MRTELPDVVRDCADRTDVFPLPVAPMTLGRWSGRYRELLEGAYAIIMGVLDAIWCSSSGTCICGNVGALVLFDVFSGDQICSGREG
jgi:hypothetical protein